MQTRVVVSIDLGTMGCRAVAYGDDGSLLGSHYVEYGVTHPEAGAAEQEAEGWWSAARACVRAVAGGRDDSGKIVAIGISAQGHSWVPTNAQFRPLRPGLTWLDTRAAPIARELLEAKGTHFWGQRAGKAPGPWHTLPQILWLREREPAVDEEAKHYLFAHDFLVARLTGQLATDFTTAAASLLFSVQEFSWDSALGAEYEIDIERFAPAVPAGSVAGALDWHVAKDLGLPAGIPVAVGAQDQKCAALGAGIAEGVATVSLGTSTAITALSTRPTYDEAAAIPCFPYLTSGTWVLEAPLVTTGASLRWLRNVVREFGAAETDYAQLTEKASTAPRGCHGVRFFPFLAGAGAPHWIADARGSFVGIGLECQPGDLVRAVLEGVAFEIRTSLDAMQKQGVEISSLRLFGGGARSDLWTAIIAGVCAMPVERRADVEAAAAGAAILAWQAAGIWDSVSEVQSVLQQPPDLFQPGGDERWEDLYREYCAMREMHWRVDAVRPSS